MRLSASGRCTLIYEALFSCCMNSLSALLTKIALHRPDPLLELGDDLLAVPQRLLLHLLEASGQLDALDVASNPGRHSYS